MVVFNENDDEIFRDNTDHEASTVHYGEGGEGLLEKLLQVRDSNDAFNCDRVDGHDLEGGRLPLALRAVITEERDLFHSECALIETPIKVITDGHSS